MSYILTTMFSYIIEMTSAALMFSSFYNTKKKLPLVLLIGMAIFSVAMIVFLIFDNLLINFITFFIVNFIFAYCLFDCSWISALILAIVLDATMMGTEFVTMNFMTIVFDINIQDYNSTDFIYFLSVSVSKIMYFVVCQVIAYLKLFVKKEVRLSETKSKSKMPIFLLIYPLCTMFACGLFWKLSLEYDFSKNINYLVVLICSLFLIAIIATYLFYNHTAKKEAEVYKLQTELERKEIDEAYYKVLDYQNEELKTLVHDEKNHLAVIKSFSNMSEVEEYVDKIYSDLNKYSSSGKTKNKMLDLILNKYKVLCESEGIDFYINIRTANLSFMENSDLTRMLSNIMDNAVEAAKKSEEKKIDLSINNVSGHDMLTCVNSSDEKPVVSSGTLKTTKKDKKFHGIGIKSIKRVVDKYDGEHEWEYDEEKKEFSTYIMFGVK